MKKKLKKIVEKDPYLGNNVEFKAWKDGKLSIKVPDYIGDSSISIYDSEIKEDPCSPELFCVSLSRLYETEKDCYVHKKELPQIISYLSGIYSEYQSRQNEIEIAKYLSKLPKVQHDPSGEDVQMPDNSFDKKENISPLQEQHPRSNKNEISFIQDRLLSEILFMIWDATDKDILNEETIDTLVDAAVDYTKKNYSASEGIAVSILGLRDLLINICRLRHSAKYCIKKEAGKVTIIKTPF